MVFIDFRTRTCKTGTSSSELCYCTLCLSSGQPGGCSYCGRPKSGSICSYCGPERERRKCPYCPQHSCNKSGLASGRFIPQGTSATVPHHDLRPSGLLGHIMMKHPGAPVPEDLEADYDAIVKPINQQAKLNRPPPDAAPRRKRKVVKGGRECVQCHEGKLSREFEGIDVVCRACVEWMTEADLITWQASTQLSVACQDQYEKDPFPRDLK